MQTVLAARGDARTVVTQFVDGGLDDDRYVVEKSLTRRVSSNPLRRRRFKPSCEAVVGHPKRRSGAARARRCP